ncbi:MAG TPA: CHAT domain-containing protein [Steroidobacteraceae bacterium]|nr:CHAT domain-containing protein [Steroidobacteraceae bacterium]
MSRAVGGRASGCGLLLALLLTGCGTTYHMGDTIQAQSPRSTAASSSPEKPANPNSAVNGPPPTDRQDDQWDVLWRTIQSPSDTVGWIDHFHVCGLKYRFRRYDELFRCLDLLDSKIAAGGTRVPKADLVQHGAPVVTGWLRATAYAELGEPEIALNWAETAWRALPEAYRQADSSLLKGSFGSRPKDLQAVESVGASLGSTGVVLEVGGEAEEASKAARDNPAALDVSPATISMSLAVQRSLLYEKLGRRADSDAALEDLRRWELTHYPGGFNSMSSSVRPYRGRAQMLELGPLYARGEYRRIVVIYEIIAAKYGALRRSQSVRAASDWLLAPINVLRVGLNAAVARMISSSDVRLFAVAVDDVSNALIYSQSLIQLGQTDKAREMLDTLLAVPEMPAMGNLYWVALYERGRIALRSGDRKQGIHLLTQSVDAIEAVRGSISFEAAKIGFAGDKQAVYAALIGAYASAGDWPHAFDYVERAKARALVDLLAERRNLTAPANADDKVRALFAQAATRETTLGVASNEDRRRGIALVAEARATLSNIAPQAASLISVQQVPVTQITGRLAAGDTLIEYFSYGDDVYAIVLDGQTLRGVTLPAGGLDEQVRAFREAINRRDGRAQELGRTLYDRLLRPVLDHVQGSQLTIAPHGILHYLPFAALSDGEGNLVDHFSIRLTPSAASLVYLPEDSPHKAGVLLALGNPDLGNRALDLPNAQTEALQVSALFPNSRALVGAEASKSAVKEFGNSFSILHFATHGRFDADAPLSSGLYLAKGSESDGVFSVGDLYSLRLDVDLVTLSACETGLGKIANGDDVIGLTRGFLYAGARTIIASLWEVDDAATAQLMEAFYRNLAQHDKRDALRLAQIETRRTHPEPWYWAAFTVVGRAN